jgi:hypothetical protein
MAYGVSAIGTDLYGFDDRNGTKFVGVIASVVISTDDTRNGFREFRQNCSGNRDFAGLGKAASLSERPGFSVARTPVLLRQCAFWCGNSRDDPIVPDGVVPTHGVERAKPNSRTCLQSTPRDLRKLRIRWPRIQGPPPHLPSSMVILLSRSALIGITTAQR